MAAAATACAFDRLLEQLRSEHRREVDALHSELEARGSEADGRQEPSHSRGGSFCGTPPPPFPFMSDFDSIVPSSLPAPLPGPSEPRWTHCGRRLHHMDLAQTATPDPAPSLPGAVAPAPVAGARSAGEADAASEASGGSRPARHQRSQASTTTSSLPLGVPTRVLQPRASRVSFDATCLHSRSAEDVTSPSQATHCLRVWWRDESLAEHRRNLHKGTGASRSSLSSPSSAQKALLLQVAEGDQSQLQRCISDPNSWHHFYWDLAGTLLIICDCFIVPLEAFQLTRSMVMQAIFSFSALFWTLDIGRTFFVGYHHRGESVTSPRLVALNYARTSLGPDALLTGLDWSGVALGVAGEYETVGYIRLFRLLRIAKTYRILKACEERIESERVSILLKIAKQLSSIVLMCHGIACTWFAIGNSTSLSGSSWLLEDGLEEATTSFQYATSFHWALTQFTPASIGVQPRNIYERCFAIVVLLFALIMFSLFISGITSALMDLRKLSSAKSQQLWLLRRYLTEAGVPKEISLRVQRYCSCAWDARTRSLQEQSVGALELLSAPLRAELRTAIFEPRLGGHPLFVLINKIAPLAMQLICTNAVARVSVARGDVLFQSGQEADKMQFINSGSLLYVLDGLGEEEAAASTGLVCAISTLRNSFRHDIVEAGTYIGEAALWLEWTYVGSLSAQNECDLVTVDAAKFQSAVCSNRHTKAEAVMYAKNFEQGLNRLEQSKVTDLYKSTMTEGLWFRLMSEFQIKKQHTQYLRGRTRSTTSLGAPSMLTRAFTSVRRDSRDSLFKWN